MSESTQNLLRTSLHTPVSVIMSLHETIFKLSIAYSEDDEGMGQSDYLRAKLGNASWGWGSLQVEFSRLLQSMKPEWRKMAQRFRETGKRPQLKPGSYKEKLFKNALKFWDHHNKMDSKDREPGGEKRKSRATKRKSTSNSNTARASKTTNKEKNGAMKQELDKAREANKQLSREKKALETELEGITEALEEESKSLGKLQIENRLLRDKLATEASNTATLTRMRGENKKLKKENEVLKTELENSKEEHQQELAKEADHLCVQQKANGVLRQQISSLRTEVEQLSNLYCLTMESFSVQTRLLQEQCNFKTLVSSGDASFEMENPNDETDATSKQSDNASNGARRISL